MTMRERKISGNALAKQMGIGETEVRRMLDPKHSSKPGKYQAALLALGVTPHSTWLDKGAPFKPARSVSRFLYPPKRAATIPLGLPLPTGSSDLPGSSSGAGRSSSPIWSCSTWGLPCQPDCSGRGALLPHHFTLTCAPKQRKRYIFCGTFRNGPL